MYRKRGRRFRSRFGRRRRQTSWLTSGAQRGNESITFDGTTQYFSIGEETNDFVANHPRFAKANDTITYLRILGNLRIGMYLANPASSPASDYVVDYGLVLVKGDYDDAGAWTQEDHPSLTETADEDDKWLFKRQCVLAAPINVTYSRRLMIYNDGVDDIGELWTGSPGDPAPNEKLEFFNQPLRGGMMSTDELLPNGSFIDLKPRRRAQYAEKLMIAVSILGDADDNREFFLTNALRVLTAKWG